MTRPARRSSREVGAVPSRSSPSSAAAARCRRRPAAPRASHPSRPTAPRPRRPPCGRLAIAASAVGDRQMLPRQTVSTTGRAIDAGHPRPAASDPSSTVTSGTSASSSRTSPGWTRPALGGARCAPGADDRLGPVVPPLRRSAVRAPGDLSATRPTAPFRTETGTETVDRLGARAVEDGPVGERRNSGVAATSSTNSTAARPPSRRCSGRSR